MSAGFIRHWLEHGEPDPYYDLNTYPCKMIGALVVAMLSYARLCPEDAADAMKVAVMVIGGILIYNGASNLWIESRYRKI